LTVQNKILRDHVHDFPVRRNGDGLGAFHHLIAVGGGDFFVGAGDVHGPVVVERLM
jgi:hypothetical protein